MNWNSGVKAGDERRVLLCLLRFEQF